MDPMGQLAHRSLGLSNGDLKESCFAEEWVGAVAWSRALYQSAEQRLKDRIVFAVVQARQWTLERLHDNKLCMAFSDQLLPMRRGKCVVRVEEEDVLSAVCIRDLEVFGARLAINKTNVRMEVHIQLKGTAVVPIIMHTCCCFESCDF